MKIRYYCRKCQQQVGELDTKKADAAQLGSDVLNDADDEQMVHMSGSGDLHVKTICDSCKENPASDLR